MTYKSISNYKTKINFDSFNAPQYSYSLNKSETYIFTPHLHNKNIAYLVTPCYIMNDDDEIKSKKANKFINKFPKSFHSIYPKKKEVFSGQIVRNYQMNLFIKHILIQIKAKSSLMIVKMI